MSKEANIIIDGLGGTSAVHRMTGTPMSTVHSWRKNGIPLSRLNHLKLAAKVEGVEWPISDEAADQSSETLAQNIGEAA